MVNRMEFMRLKTIRQKAMNKLVAFKYKQVKVLHPHCPECNEKLQGNGSVATPYLCACGIWEYVRYGKYEITPLPTH